MTEELFNRCEAFLDSPRLLEIFMEHDFQRPKNFQDLQKSRQFETLSSGEKVLIRLCFDVFNGQGKVSFEDLSILDKNNRHRALSFLAHNLINE